MTIRRSQDKLIFDYHINELFLIPVYCAVGLGFVFSPNLSFGSHIDVIIFKKLRMLGFIHRTVSDFDSASCLVALYNTLV